MDHYKLLDEYKTRVVLSALKNQFEDVRKQGSVILFWQQVSDTKGAGDSQILTLVTLPTDTTVI